MRSAGVHLPRRAGLQVSDCFFMTFDLKFVCYVLRQIYVSLPLQKKNCVRLYTC